jgi:peroxiredoxin
MSDGMQWIVRFELPNGGPGPETVASDDLAAEFDAVVVLLLREHYCQVSRNRASAYSDAVDSFLDEGVAVVAALPDTDDRAAYWRKRYGLDFPVLADSSDVTPESTETADDAGESGSGPRRGSGPGSSPAAMADGTPRFDAFSDIELGVDSLPGIGVLDTSSKFPRLVHTEGGDTIQDCPTPEKALDVATDVIS